MTNTFKKRCFGFVIVKSTNSNYNADFTGNPRTLPDGTVYATDKALKFAIRHFLKNEYPDKKIFVYKRFNKNGNPYTPLEAYENFFNTEIKKDTSKDAILKNLLSALDVRLFGITFAPKGKDEAKDKNVSIHGAVQISHGVNIWKEGNIYSEQIMSPFRNPGKESDAEKSSSTLGRQAKLQEGHYLHNFSINPKNVESVKEIVSDSVNGLSEEDINLLKEGLRKGVSYYDSASKIGTENELLCFIELREDSKIVLPSFTDLVNIDKKDGMVVFDFSKLKEELKKYEDHIAKCEIYINKTTSKIENKPEFCEEKDL